MKTLLSFLLKKFKKNNKKIKSRDLATTKNVELSGTCILLLLLLTK